MSWKSHYMFLRRAGGKNKPVVVAVVDAKQGASKQHTCPLWEDILTCHLNLPVMLTNDSGSEFISLIFFMT